MKKSIVCRCEDITEEEVICAIREGYTDLEELRKKLRLGMGPCQGRCCMPLVKRILQKETGKTEIPDDSLHKARPPVVPIPLSSLASEEKKPKEEEES